MRVSTLDFRRSLRRGSTAAERRLWALLRAKRLTGFKFRRQHPVGPYVIDFFCQERAVAVEADGGQHFTDDGLRRDEARDQFLATRDVRVLRFTDRQVLAETSWVVESIWRALNGER
ncbi:MAG TPA: endonuclease domain-containing protein [Anaeromyxobacteraceae bacterium]|nr:endonuclease domain-containing protein [Anaeromyxobacteraceae bacterium]